MKRYLKIIRNKIGKILLKLVVKSKKFDLLPRFVVYFPKERYRASFQLLKRGYLNLAYDIMQEYEPKENERYLKQRIESMIEIKNKGLTLEKNPKKPIKNISVLFAVHNSFPYDHAGYAIRTEHIASNLQKRGIDLMVATRPGYPWDLQKHRELKTRNRHDTVHGIEYIRLEDPYKTFKRGSDMDYINTYADELVSVARQNGTTILHAHSNYINGLAAVHAGKTNKIPSIYEIRGLWFMTRTTLDPKFRDEGMYTYEMEMEKAAANASDAVVTISYALKNLLIQWGTEAEKIHVIPNAVDTSFFVPLEKDAQLLQQYNLSNKTVIGFVGSLTGYEGLKELILATEELIKEKSNICLIIVGDGRELKKLKTLAKSPEIIFTGRVPFEEVKRYYSLFDICPFPRNDYEVCQYVPPLKILEAMTMKKPVIVSDVAPLLEIITDNENGLVCRADSIKSLKEKLFYLIENVEERKMLAEQGYNWVQKNRSWDTVIKKYIQLYNLFKDNDSEKK